MRRRKTEKVIEKVFKNMQNKGLYVNFECVRIAFNSLFSMFNIYCVNQALLMPSALAQALLQPWAVTSINPFGDQNTLNRYFGKQ